MGPLGWNGIQQPLKYGCLTKCHPSFPASVSKMMAITVVVVTTLAGLLPQLVENQQLHLINTRVRIIIHFRVFLKEDIGTMTCEVLRMFRDTAWGLPFLCHTHHAVQTALSVLDPPFSMKGISQRVPAQRTCIPTSKEREISKALPPSRMKHEHHGLIPISTVSEINDTQF